ncbi:MAG: FmdB family zinc ribbon protein [Clostridia bacterium]
MPTYDYVCPRCGEEFSAFVTMSERDRVPCPNCDSAEVRQRITTVHRAGRGCGEACSTGGCSGCKGCR